MADSNEGGVRVERVVRRRGKTMDEQTRLRVVSVASRLVGGMVSRGEIPCTNEAIRAAMPQAVADAKEAVLAAEEYICG